MDVELEPFNATEHLGGAAEVLHRVRAATKTYPPPVDADDTPASFSAWLDDGEDYLGRWVAVREGRVIGHVSVVEPHDYILRFLGTLDVGTVRRRGLVEITKFFVDPDVQRGGVGSRLFARALDFATGSELTPVLAVVSTSTDARRFYGREGMTEVGQFEGRHGTNHVFTLFR
jgi:GNAT superfamily N-acetyltransferase